MKKNGYKSKCKINIINLMKRCKPGKRFILGIIICIFNNSVALTEESQGPAKKAVVSSGKKVPIENSFKLEDKSCSQYICGYEPIIVCITL